MIALHTRKTPSNETKKDGRGAIGVYEKAPKNPPEFQIFWMDFLRCPDSSWSVSTGNTIAILVEGPQKSVDKVNQIK